jgi:hypothetical protein
MRGSGGQAGRIRRTLKGGRGRGATAAERTSFDLSSCSTPSVSGMAMSQVDWSDGIGIVGILDYIST